MNFSHMSTYVKFSIDFLNYCLDIYGHLESFTMGLKKRKLKCKFNTELSNFDGV